MKTCRKFILFCCVKIEHEAIIVYSAVAIGRIRRSIVYIIFSPLIRRIAIYVVLVVVLALAVPIIIA